MVLKVSPRGNFSPHNNDLCIMVYDTGGKLLCYCCEQNAKRQKECEKYDKVLNCTDGMSKKCYKMVSWRLS